MNYNKLIEECFFNPQHVGELDIREARVLVERIGDRFELYLSWSETGHLTQARFKARGNPYVIAGVEWLCRQIQGTSVLEHPRLTYQDMVTGLAIPKLHYPVAVLIERGYNSAIKRVKDDLKGDRHE